MQLDQILFIVALSAYIVGTLALFTYFLSRERWMRNVGIPFAILGCGAQFAALAARYEISHIWPLTNLYGSLSLFSAMSVAIFVAFAFRYDLWFIGGFVQFIAAGFLAYASTWNEGYMPAVPALQSYWIKIHVPLVVSSYAAFMVAFVVAGLYLLKYYLEERLGRRRSGGVMRAAAAAGAGGGVALTLPLGTPRATSRAAYAGEYVPAPSRQSPGVVDMSDDTPNIALAAEQGDQAAAWLHSWPTLAKLDIMTYRIVAVGLPLLTLGIITGAWWAKEAWGAYWQWDPKETAALFSWIVYASYMHLHTRNAWRGLRCAWVSVFGFASIIFCYLGVNIWISGLHSYKM